ncbi:MAG TPA: hypothetical protein VN112_02305 [Ensifer sp.]|nr:hypothetical protein [Ensifer sp.]
MTSKAFIKTADLLRMAKVAKEFDVVVWYEANGVRIGVSPENDATKKEAAEASKRKRYEDIRL